MPVSLLRTYGAYPMGSVVSLPASTEAALVAQNLANYTVALPTAGNMTSQEHSGRVTIGTGTLSVVVSNPNVNASTKVLAEVNQATADGTLTAIARVVPANGSFTIYGNANATAPVGVDWALPSSGMTPNQ
jgi:hypothetical protein